MTYTILLLAGCLALTWAGAIIIPRVTDCHTECYTCHRRFYGTMHQGRKWYKTHDCK